MFYLQFEQPSPLFQAKGILTKKTISNKWKNYINPRLSVHHQPSVRNAWPSGRACICRACSSRTFSTRDQLRGRALSIRLHYAWWLRSTWRKIKENANEMKKKSKRGNSYLKCALFVQIIFNLRWQSVIDIIVLYRLSLKNNLKLRHFSNNHNLDHVIMTALTLHNDRHTVPHPPLSKFKKTVMGKITLSLSIS